MARPRGPNEISESALKRIAAEFKILSEPLRLRILNQLRSGERNVSEIIRAVRASQSNVSKHLATLNRAGFVARRRDGFNVFYSIRDPTVFQLCDLMCSKFKAHFEIKKRESASPP